MVSAASLVGIDVSKAILDVAVRPTGETWQIPNEPERMPDLVSRLRGVAPYLIVLEATGGFEHTVVAALSALLTRRRQLLEMLTAEHNRLGFARAPQIRRGLQ
jgi:transposase